MPIAARHATSLFDILTGLGLTSGLQTCLDAGDSNSVSGSDTRWRDTSGNGQDFFVGNSDAAEATDPTHNGTPGNLSLSEYFSFDGGDRFQYDSANETWMDNIHKDGWVGSACFLVNIASFTLQGFFGTCGSTGPGNRLSILAGANAGKVRWQTHNGSAFQTLADSTNLVTVSQADFVTLSADEPNGNVIIGINENFEAYTSVTYTSPSASAPFATLNIGSNGGVNGPMTNGSRMYMAALWDGVYRSQADWEAIYDAIANGVASGGALAGPLIGGGRLNSPLIGGRLVQ